MTTRKKPANLLYDVDESPGTGTLILLGLQHIFLISIAFVFPVLVVDAIDGTAADARHIISVSMLITGVATILQGLRRGPVGSGYLCPLLNGPAFLSASVLAGKTGGLALIFGMTFVGGLFETLFSRLVTRMRAVFPTEVTGTIVTMVGIEIIPFGVSRFFGLDATHPMFNPTAATTALVTLVAMMGFTVWGKGKLRLYAVLIGMLVGYSTAWQLGLFSPEALAEIAHSPWFSWPSPGAYGMSFDLLLLIPFLVAALSSALKTVGDLTTCQKINDAGWRRPDMQTISRGVLASATGNLLSGLAGALGQSSSSSNIGLSIATGVTSRTVSYATGGLLILLAFLPKIAALFVIMPPPIMGATLVFSASFMVMAGIQIMLTRMIDARKTFIIGTSIVFGLSVDFHLGIYQDFPEWLQPFFQSSLSLTALSAILLNLLMRIGIAKTARMELVPGVDASDQVFAFMVNQGGLWGAMPDVIYRAAAASNEILESVTSAGIAQGPLHLVACFDEYNLDVEIRYRGTPMVFPPAPPSEEEVRALPQGQLLLSEYLIRQIADQVEIGMKDGLCLIRLHYNH